MSKTPIEKRPFWFLLLGVMIISFSPILVKLSHAPALQIGFYRNLFALALLLPLVLLKRDSWSAGKWTVLLPMAAGALFFCDLWSWHVAIGLIGPGTATLLGNFQVFFVALFALLLLKERLRTAFVLSVPAALVGVYLIVGTASETGVKSWLGVGLSLFAALCYSAFILVMRKSQAFERKLSADMNLLYMTVCACALFAATMLVKGESFALAPDTSFWALLANGVLPHVLGWTVISRCLPLLKASVAGITLLSQSVLAFIWEVVIFNQSFSALQILGGLIAVIAIYFGSQAQQKPRG